MQPELRLVRYFVAVAEERNITRAAERLHISQPALSAAVRQLEQLLGVELLDRSDRVLAVTPAGELLLAEGRGLLAEADRVFEAVRGRDAAVVGRLRIGLDPDGALRARACAAGRLCFGGVRGDALPAGGHDGSAAAGRAERAAGPCGAVLCR